MNTLEEAVEELRKAQVQTKKPIAIVLAGHNGSGKSTLWHKRLADTFRIPLINADKMMMSILPEPNKNGHLVSWAQSFRDADPGWMSVAQKGVLSFIAHAIGKKVPFAMETVFSYWELKDDSTYASKIDLIKEMQVSGYFVILFFVGLANVELSVLRVQTRVRTGGHGVNEDKLRSRFPRTQSAVSAAIEVSDAAILVDNSLDEKSAFTVCRVQCQSRVIMDIRDGSRRAPRPVADWMSVVVPYHPI